MRFVNFIKKPPAYVYLIMAIAAISTAAIMIRFVQGSMDSLSIATYRLLFSTIIIFPFSFRKLKSDSRKLESKDWIFLSISGLLLAAHFASWISSLRMTNVISSVVLVTTTPIWVTIFTPLILKTRISKRFILGLLIAFLGIVLLTIGENEMSLNDGAPGSAGNIQLKGNILAIIGAICAAGYTIIGKTLRRNVSNESYVLIVYGIAAILLLFTTVLTGSSLSIPGKIELGWLLLLALIPQSIGHSLLNWSLGKIPAHIVSLALLGESIGSTIFAMLFLQEFPSQREWMFSVIILIGIVTAVFKPVNAKGRTQQESL